MATTTVTQATTTTGIELHELHLHATAQISPPAKIQLPSITIRESNALASGANTPPFTPGPTTPRSERRVFDVAPSNILTPSKRLLITFLIMMANLVQFVSNAVTIGAGFSFSRLLGAGDVGPGQANWMAASFALTQGAFVLISGRLGAVYGHQRILLLGLSVIVFFSLINGFCTTYNTFVAARAFTGIGGGLIMPNAVAMITIMLPPGRSRNITTGIFAGSAPIGGWLGILLGGIFTQLTNWQYLFWFLAGLGTVVGGGLWWLFPREQPVDKGGKIDYIGAALGLSGMILFNVVWNQAPSVGWSTPYEIVLLLLSLALFGSFLLWESRCKEPIMPLSIFTKAPTFGALVLVVLLSYMSFGISLWYMIAWQQLVRGWTVMELAVGWIPFGLGAATAVLFAAWLIPRLAAQWIMAIGVAATLVANLLLATMPEQQNYWIQTFPAILISSTCPDFVYVAAQIIASNSVGRREQGIAGSLIGTLNLYGNALGLGFAGTIETEVHKYPGSTQVKGYRAALFFGFALAVAALMLDFAWVRMPKDDREGWVEGDDIEMDDAQLVTGGTTGAEVSGTSQGGVARSLA
ncbi:major facilitator superfamily domain-containing protein [Diplogelasinospora grovesii]|uniref:Major facilitator superfamily domain-containing protein n=1 Tax=Diplogelasinospora grovesii TaxID=303347 RepID=A0AAN6MYM0_9PEZI|nr:major facilitator superfamily domain-containing protein [Diplogelasinospora grovesii]